MDRKRLIGLKIKAARKRANLTRREVVLRLRKRGYDLTESTIYNWERGYTSPLAYKIHQLAEVLGIDPKDFLCA
jgi:transcriptional regulator with XRE-family HTH domain